MSDITAWVQIESHCQIDILLENPHTGATSALRAKVEDLQGDLLR